MNNDISSHDTGSREDLLNMLDIVYELEGVLHLAVTRYDDLPDALPRIIRRKIEELGACCPGVALRAENDHYPDPDSDRASDSGGTYDSGEAYDPDSGGTYDNEHEEAYEEESEDYAEEDGEEDVRTMEAYAGDASGVATIGEKNPPAFSLNDRFLFTRELFGGSRHKFDEALDRLAQFDSMEEAEAYFYDECSLDPAEETVADFMRIVEGYLKNQ